MQHQVVSRDQWLKAQVGLLKDEKELTRRSDELARRRRSCLGPDRQGLSLRDR